MINEVVPFDPLQDFYGIPGADYLKTTIPLFQGGGGSGGYFDTGHITNGYLYHQRR